MVLKSWELTSFFLTPGTLQSNHYGIEIRYRDKYAEEIYKLQSNHYGIEIGTPLLWDGLSFMSCNRTIMVLK